MLLDPPLPDKLSPDFMAHLKAKSADRNGHMQTLAEHTWAVLARLSDQYRLRPDLSDRLQHPRLWHQLFYACLLHDFGKAALGFQERLKPSAQKNAWSQGRHRHEVLSLAFVDWLFPQGHIDRIPVICIIIAHHKDVSMIWDKYGAGLREEDEIARVEWLTMQIQQDDVIHLWKWLDQYRHQWQAELGFSLQEETKLLGPPSINALAICNALDECSDYLEKYDGLNPNTAHRSVDISLRGLILTADHAASGGSGPFPNLVLDREMALRPLTIKKHQPREHQQKAGETPLGSAIMISPTGSGKTEAAMNWAAQQREHKECSRLFYTLPYQASMNAMYERIATRFLNYDTAELQGGKVKEVTIQHSRAKLKFYQDMMELDELTPAEAQRRAKMLQNLGRLNSVPIQVFSPYQMLKAAYSLKGYETLLVDYTDALFIFDEIHAYDPGRLALIITMIGWLRTNFGARFFVMTATLPPPVQRRLEDALGIDSAKETKQIIIASQEEFKRSQRHIVHLKNGQLRNQITQLVEADWAEGKAILICLNRVSQAQHVYALLQQMLNLNPDKDIVLLHSRFNGKDRNRKETLLMQRAGVGKRAPGDAPFVVIATQVVEVSLDIDFDILYTDPAPLDALLQRLGRVNRGRPVDPHNPHHCPVVIFREPSVNDDQNSDEDEKRYLPYAQPLVQASLQVLTEQVDGKVIDEGQVTTMLSEIYQGEILEDWEERYEKAATEFQTVVLNRMVPFESADRSLWEKFYKMFDGREVLPIACEKGYMDAIEDRKFLDAQKYLVSISQKWYHMLRGKGYIIEDTDEGYADRVTDAIRYTEEEGLQLDDYFNNDG